MISELNTYAVKMEHIFKSFAGIKALDDVSFYLKKGEVMALVGENGAGKSTLMKILTGVYTRDSGDVQIFGKSVGNLNPKEAMMLGVAIIHQELNLCNHLTVAQNIFLGRELQKNGIMSSKEMNLKTKTILNHLNISVEPETIVGNLAVSKQQMVEIAKALSTHAKIIIMDEPTSALSERETKDLFAIIMRLKQDGCSIVYISHRLEELQYIADRITIMRDGKLVTSGNCIDFSMDEIISKMVGRKIKEKYPHVSCRKGKKILEVKHLNAGKMVQDINFDIYEGEIVGIAGLMGAGRTETTRAIFGADPKEYGKIFLDGKEVKIQNPRDAIQAGIVLVPEDRKKDGLFTRLSIKANISMPNLDLLDNKLKIVSRNKEYSMAQKIINDLHIKTFNPDVMAENLSGGNQQKVVIAKWLVRHSQVVIFDEPTRGIDVAAKVEIYNLMNKLKQNGIGVLFVSSEMPEIIGMSDRILVMCEGHITGELDAKNVTQERILAYATMYNSKNIAG